MIARPDRDLPTVRCGECSGAPVLATHDPEHREHLCVRCQGRELPVPHPGDHLCERCRGECPSCFAPGDGTKCRSCRRECRTCGGSLPELPKVDKPTKVPASVRKDRHRRWDRIFYNRPSLQEQCGPCQARAQNADPVGTVLAALPERLVRACGGRVPRTVVEALHAELRSRSRTPLQLAARIERRWWKTWAQQPLERTPDDDHEGWRPDDVALWLITPTSCPERCEDGWHLANSPDLDDKPCEACQGGRLLGIRNWRSPSDEDTGDGAERASTAADRTLTEAVTYRSTTRECNGQDGACGVPVAEPHTLCPACADWPWCPSCRRRRYNPETASACLMCTAVHTA